MVNSQSKTELTSMTTGQESGVACFGLPSFRPLAPDDDKSGNYVRSTGMPAKKRILQWRPVGVAVSGVGSNVKSKSGCGKKRQLGMHSFLRAPLSSEKHGGSIAEVQVPHEERNIPSSVSSSGTPPAPIYERSVRISSESSHHKKPSTATSSATESTESTENYDGHAEPGNLVGSREGIDKMSDEESSTTNTVASHERRRGRSRSRREINHYTFATRNSFKPFGDAPSMGRNVLSSILHRSSHTVRQRVGPMPSLQRFAHADGRWGVSNTVELESTGGSAVTCMDFDMQGVLLATADVTGTIRVFDFDEVNAADIKSRNHFCRKRAAYLLSAENKDSDRTRTCRAEKNSENVPKSETSSCDSLSGRTFPGEKIAIRPVVSFSVKNLSRAAVTSQVTSIKWNKYCEDELAVSFLTQNEIRVYDVASCTLEGTCPKFISLMVDKLHRRHSRGEGTTSFVFLPSIGSQSRLVSGSTRGAVRLWTFPQFADAENPEQMHPKVKMRWEFSNVFGTDAISDNEGISDMVPVNLGAAQESLGFMLIGGNKGSVVLLDMNKCTRKAFSTTLTPTVMQQWNLSKMVLEQQLLRSQLPPLSWMGVKKICAWRRESEGCVKTRMTEASTLNITASLVLNCGWICELRTDIATNKSRIAMVHIANKITYLNSDYEIIDKMTDSFSLPRYATPAAELTGSSSLLCLADVKPQHLVLADKNKRILNNASLPNMIDLHSGNGEMVMIVDLGRSSTRGSVVQEARWDNVVSKISIGSAPPRSLIIHPSSEWMIVASEGTKQTKLFHNRLKFGM